MGLDAQQASSWQELDRNAISHILSFLDNPKDLANLGRTCTDLRDLSRTNILWSALLEKHFGLDLPSTTKLHLYGIYKQLYTFKSLYALPFRGLCTDGGVDDNDTHYWVDNMFVPTNWAPYCSNRSPNVHCLGVMQVGLQEAEKEVQERAFLVRSLQRAATRLFMSHHVNMVNPDKQPELVRAMANILHNWSTSALQALFMRLFQDLLQHQPPGGRLVPPPASSLGCLMVDEMAMHGMTRKEAMDLLFAKSALYTQPAELHRFSPQVDGLYKEDGMKAHDRRLLPLLQNPGFCRHFGVVHEIAADGRGEFTCPLRVGAVFATCVETPLCNPQEAMDVFPHQPYVAALDSLCDAGSVMSAATEGLLPPVLHHCRHHFGEYIEFARLPAPLQRGQKDGTATMPVLQPLVWFRFYSRAEMAQNERHAFEIMRQQLGSTQSTGNWQSTGPAHEDSQRDEDSEVETSQPESSSLRTSEGGTDEDEEIQDESAVMEGDDDGPAEDNSQEWGSGDVGEDMQAAGHVSNEGSSPLSNDEGAEVDVQRHTDDDEGIGPDEFDEALQQMFGEAQSDEQQEEAGSDDDDDNMDNEENQFHEDAPAAGFIGNAALLANIFDEIGIQTLAHTLDRVSRVVNEFQSGQLTSTQASSGVQWDEEEGGPASASSSSHHAGSANCISAAAGTADTGTFHVIPKRPGPEVSETQTHRRHDMRYVRIKLRQPRVCNMVCVKLITHEDRMREMQDMHDHPNIDVQYVALKGCVIRLSELCKHSL